MGENSTTDASKGVREYGARREGTEVECIEHRRVGAQVAAPTHTHRRKHGNIVTRNDTLFNEGRHQPNGGAHGAEGRHRKSDELR